MKHWTQRDLAVKVGVDQMLVSKWERGWHRPSESNLHALAHELGVSVAWLYTDRTADPQASVRVKERETKAA